MDYIIGIDPIEKKVYYDYIFDTDDANKKQQKFQLAGLKQIDIMSSHPSENNVFKTMFLERGYKLTEDQPYCLICNN